MDLGREGTWNPETGNEGVREGRHHEHVCRVWNCLGGEKGDQNGGGWVRDRKKGNKCSARKTDHDREQGMSGDERLDGLVR